MKFGRSLIFAGGITTGVLTAAVGIGALFDFGRGEGDLDPAPTGPISVILDPVALDRSGYNLKRRTVDDLISVSISMTVPGPEEQAIVCRLQPRLRAIVIRDLGLRLRAAAGREVKGEDFNDFLHQKFRRAVGKKTLDRVSVSFVSDQRKAPVNNCPKPEEEKTAGK